MSQYFGTGRLGTTQSATFTTTAGTITNAVGAQTYRVRVAATTDAFIAIGKAPTATTSDAPVFAGVPEYFTIAPGEKVSALQISAGGTVYVTEIP